MEINDQPLTAMDLLRLAFLGTAIEPHIKKEENELLQNTLSHLRKTDDQCRWSACGSHQEMQE